jgi:hypothetical protein
LVIVKRAASAVGDATSLSSVNAPLARLSGVVPVLVMTRFCAALLPDPPDEAAWMSLKTMVVLLGTATGLGATGLSSVSFRPPNSAT